MTSSMTTARDHSTARVFGPRRRRAAAHPTGPDAGGTRNRAGRPRSVRIGWAVSGAAALSLLAAACGGGYGTGAATTPSGGGDQYAGDQYGGAAATSSGARPAAVDVRTSALGPTLVDGGGRTLYLFEADGSGQSRCTGGCAAAWPPYLGAGAPQAGTGVTGSLLATITRGDGGAQVTYGGHPLYYYAGDARPGDDAGQGLDQFGAKWYVLGPDGAKIDQD